MRSAYTAFVILFLASVVITLDFLSFPTSAAVTEQGPEETTRLIHQVKGLLKQKCLGCHGDDPALVMGDLDLTTHANMLKKGTSGVPALIPGHPENSPLYQAVTWKDPNFRMPPQERNRLSPQEVALLHRWIALGAPWADDVQVNQEIPWSDEDPESPGEGIRVRTSGGLSPEWDQRLYDPNDLWAYQPVKRYAVPWESLEQGRQGNPIDAFIHRKLNQLNLKPAAAASKRIWIRRATYDLIGLPPTPREIEAFLQDESKDAHAKVIDRLLDSPHYGEQWGRHWLDVVRYADTSGFANDFERPNAWRYRDYVIRSFNQDKPFDRFIVEQLAGDELDPDNAEMLVAVGFLRGGPWEHTAMSVALETRQLFLNDVTNIVGEAFLATPLGCARCHDHKFDPIPTKDFYRMQAVFAATQFTSLEAAFLPGENQNGFTTGRERVQRLIKEAQADLGQIATKEEKAAQAWFKKRGMAYHGKKERRKLPEAEQPPRYIGLNFQDLGQRKALQKRIQRLKWQLERYEALAFSVYNGPTVEVSSHAGQSKKPKPKGNTVPETHILQGGSVYAPTEVVTPGVLSALPASNDQVEATAYNTIPADMEGRRLALAQWIANANNPLTARVMVNRIWQYHFGQGLAGNPNNFGKTGKKPTHPELLDWLAQYFVEHRWSIKALHRLIMQSQTYRRSGQHPEMDQLKQQDPDNQWLAYFSPRRLTGEELRDSMLAVSGELNRDSGGLPAWPEINMEAALQPRHIMGSIAEAYQPSRLPAERNRRSIYTYRMRGLTHPMMEVFNQPNMDASCERRSTSTVTPQVFSLFNSQNSYDRALAFARRLENETADPPKRLQMAFQIVYGRAPREGEVKQAQQYLDKMTSYHRQHPVEPRAYPTHIERNMFEEMTGEAFKYTERLDIYEDYVPDLKPWDVGPETRAWADLCLVLFNANEFVYIY